MKKTKKNGNYRIQSFLVWLICQLALMLLAEAVWSTNDAGKLAAPDWFPFVGVMLPIALSISFKRRMESRIHSKEAVTPQKSAQNIHTPIEVNSLTDMGAAVIYETGQASVSMLQRKLNLSYAPAACIMDWLEKAGVVGQFRGSAPREILMSRSEYEAKKVIVEEYVPDTPEPPAIRHVSPTDEFAQYGGVDAVLLSIDLMEGHAFEHWCAGLLCKNGFTNVSVTPGSGDQGVDVLAEKDGIHYAVQCKCYRNPLGNTPIQEVHAGKEMYHCQIGAVITNQYFTPGAIALAEKTGTLLWDRDWIRASLIRQNSQK